MDPDRSWMYHRISGGYITPEFVRGVDEFIEFATSHPECMSGDKLKCPCIRPKCQNKKFLPIDDIKLHLYQKGFVPNYYTWYLHGEEEEVEDVVELSRNHMRVPNVHGNENAFEQGGRYCDMIIDALHQEGMYDEVDDIEEEPNSTAKKLYDMLEAGKKELWAGCKNHSLLSAVARMLNMKAEHHLSEKCFDQLLEFIKEVLPEGNVMPESLYKTKKLVEGLGLPMQQIDCCEKNCMIYWGDDIDLQQCKFCSHPRYKECMNESTNKVVCRPFKKMFYFPLIPRLQRLYASEATAEHMRWHREHESEEGVMHHPSDSPAWKHFNTAHPSFSGEKRNVLLGLSTDGFQPFGQSGKQYSSWPVVVTPYNLPPWMCMKTEYMFLSTIVPGPNNPKFKIDVFLQPLIAELKLLWEVGVDTYDVSKKQNFLMRAALLWTISDFPAYAMLSGWSTAGRLACPHCMDNTDAFTLQNGRKQSWFDCHRKFLPQKHAWRKNKNWFKKNRTVTDDAPRIKTGEEILNEIESLGLMKVTEIGADEYNAKISENSGWKKRSIFWDLPYWSSLLIRHNLDVMHIEKNFFDNLFNTIMNIDGKTKDNVKAREDMVNICRRKELERNPKTGKFPKACYALEKEGKKAVCEWLKSLRFPDGYVSNMARCVDLKKYRTFGMKSHDCHVFMQRLLPIAFRELLATKIWEAITEISSFFKQLTSTVISENDMSRLEEEIPIILCKLERYFPPGFFDSMEHLPIHLAYEARIAGPVQYRWMYPFERYNGKIKKNVRNKARVEGSIANAYLVEEASSFCAYYFEDHVYTRHCRVPRNDDGGINDCDEIEGNLSIFKSNGRSLGKARKRRLTDKERNAAHSYILLNCDEVTHFIEVYTNLLHSSIPNVSNSDVDRLLENEFPKWFKDHVHNPENQVNDQFLKDLAWGPLYSVNVFTGYFINGYKFHTEGRSVNKATSNSGVCIRGTNYSDVSSDFYGKLQEVIEVEYPALPIKRTVLFRCDWFDTTPNIGTKIHPTYGIVDVNRTRRYHKYEPFILATQAEQVCFVSYPSLRRDKGDWLSVIKVKARSTIHQPVISLSLNDNVDAPFQEEEAIQPFVGRDANLYERLNDPNGDEVELPENEEEPGDDFVEHYSSDEDIDESTDMYIDDE